MSTFLLKEIVDNAVVENPGTVTGGVVVHLSGAVTASFAYGPEDCSATAWQAPLRMQLRPASTMVFQEPTLVSLETVDSRAVKLTDLIAVAKALLEPGVLDYESVRKELGLE